MSANDFLVAQLTAVFELVKKEVDHADLVSANPLVLDAYEKCRKQSQSVVQLTHVVKSKHDDKI